MKCGAEANGKLFRARAGRQDGLSLIELMIAMVIGLVLMLGLLRVFAASREAARLAEGAGRVQENGRFALDFLQRDLRMIGHLGCLNDQAYWLRAKSGSTDADVVPTTFALTADNGSPSPLNFARGLFAYGASNTGAGTTLKISGNRPTAAWAGNPALPTYISGLVPAPIPGSDIIALRYFAPLAVPVRSIAMTGGGGAPQVATVLADEAAWKSAMLTDGYSDDNLSLLGIADCTNVATFQMSSKAISNGAGGVTFTVTQNSGLNGSLGTGFPMAEGQTMLYRAETEVFYVGWPAGGEPTLYRARFTKAPGAGGTLDYVGGAPEALVEGIESMQMLHGLDLQPDASAGPPTGYIGEQRPASAVAGRWGRVGLIQVGLLSRSPARASADQVDSKSLLGSPLELPEDGRYRTVYESTIALRNRLFGN